jgi:integrase
LNPGIVTGRITGKDTSFISSTRYEIPLYYTGGQATTHGFRALASTILNESGFHPDVIERQLAHIERNKVRAAYHRAEYLGDRLRMMEWWG